MPTERSDVEEKRLLSLATQGDKKAFGVLYERYLDEIYRYAYYRLGDQHEAEDITADTFTKTWEYLPKIHQQEASIYNFRSWLYRVAKNLIIDHYKKKKTLPLLNSFHIDQDSTKKIAEQQIQSRYLTKAILALRPDYQQIIILRFINQLSHKEVAEIMELSTVQSRVLQYRALKKLKELLSDESN
jgi:RNA polymerase sigma-70 factor (ECF subfamily)